MRLKAIAAERPPTIARVIQSACHHVGSPRGVKPRAASNAPRKANGSAKSVCSILIISSVVRMLLAAVVISSSFKAKAGPSSSSPESARRHRKVPRAVVTMLAKCQTTQRAWRFAKDLRSTWLPVVGRLGHLRVGPLHPAFGPVQILKAEPSVESVRVLRRQNPAAKALQLRVRDDRLHQPLRQAAPAVPFEYEHVGEPGEGRVVRHDAGETDQLRPVIDAERQRVLDCAPHDGDGTTLAPVTFIADVTVDDREVEPPAFGADGVLAVVPLHNH